jgi:hypothetical protein
MPEIVIIVESEADARTAQSLAECVLLEKVDWLESYLLKDLLQWCGLEDAAAYSCWKKSRLS